MNFLATRRVLITSSALVLFLGLVVVYGLGRIASAENKPTSLLSSKDQTILSISDNIVPDNPVKMKFLRGIALKNGTDRTQLTGDDSAQMKPLSLASGDLNGDGFPDLVTGYGTPNGGVLIVRYGSDKAFAPTDPADISAFIENRFAYPFSAESVISLDHAPDFLFTGDFDRDSRRDILTAAKGGIGLNVLQSEGGEFSRRTIDLSGQLSVVAVAEAFSADGFADIYAGIVGGRLLAFEKSKSVFEQMPDTYSLPGTASSIALGRFDGGTTADFAVVVSGDVYVVHGDLNGKTERVDVPFAARSVAAADFIWDRDTLNEIAVASENGTTSILSRGVLNTTPFTAEELRTRRQQMVDVREGRMRAPVVSDRAFEGWRIAEQTSVNGDLVNSNADALIPLLASGQQSVDLLAVGRSGLGITYRTDGLSPAFENVSRQSVSFATDEEPVAVLPMRLNMHARPSIVVLGKDNPEPQFLFFAPEAVFIVTKTADTNDGTCGVDCSLREAVGAANAAAGADSITFVAGLNGSAIQLTRVGDDNTNVNGDLDINSDITITGNGTANTIIQGSDNATFTNNMGDKAIGVNQSGAFTTLNFTMSNLTVRFTRNSITTNAGFTQTGGAMDIFLTGGGAIPGPTTTLTTVVFDSNANLHSYGGALNIDSGAGAGGAGTYRGTVQITGSTFQNNDTLTTTDDALNDFPRGGAINMFADRHNVTISSSTLTGNQTSAMNQGTGGAINMRHSNGGTITINSATNITNNISGSYGGGIMSFVNHTFSMTGGSISGNTSQGTGDSAAGGGLYNVINDTFSTTLTSVSITNNIATAGVGGTGGGVNDSSNSPMSLTTCTITGNSADFGGGIAAASTGGTQTATLTNTTTFSGNTATTGSAIHSSAGIVVLSGSHTISGNIAVDSASTSALTSAVGSTTNLTGNLTIGDGTFTGNNGVWNITGNYSQTGGTFNANTGNYGITGSFTQSAGIFNMNTATLGVGSGLTFSGATFNGGGTVNVTGTHTISGGTFTSNGGNYTITGAFSQSSGIFSGNTSTWNVSSGSTVSGGTFNGGGTFNVTGTHTISGGTFNAGGTLTITGVGNFTQTAGAFNGGSATVNLTGNFSFSGAGSFAGGTGTFNFNGGGAQSISSTSVIGFNHISDANASQPLVFNNSINVGGTLTANGVNTILQPVAAAVIGGTGSLTGTGTARVTRATGTNDFLTQYTMPTKTLTNLLVDYAGAAPQGISGTTYTNVRLNNASGGTLSANATVNGTLTLAAGAFNVGTSTLTLNSVITSTGGTLTSGATGTVIYNQSSINQVVLAGQYGNLTFSAFSKILPASGTVFISGTFTPGGAGSHTITGSTIDFNGTGAQTIPAFSYNNLTISGARGANNVTLVNGGTIGIAGTFNPTATFGGGNYVITNNTINFNGSGSQTIPAFGYNNLTSSNTGTRTLANAGIIRIAGVFTPGTNGYTITDSTVEFNGTLAQTLPPSFTTYNNLTLNNLAGVTGFAGLTVQGLLRVQAGTFTSSSTYNNVQIDSGTTLAGTNATTINVTGNWTNNGTFTANSNTVAFNGSAPQTIGGTSPTTFNNLTINNGTGITLNTDATVNGVFTLQNGEVTSAANTLTLGNSATVSRTSGHVVGNLRKNFGAPGPLFRMPVGTAGAYTPLDVTVTLGSGQLTARVSTGVPAVLIPIQTRTLQRYWTLSGSGIRSNLTFNYLDGDVPPPPNDENIWNIIRVTGTTAVRYSPTQPFVFMNPGANQFTINDLDSYSDWTAGEPLAPTAANANISGRVVGPDGRGVYGARVALQNQEGNIVSAITNPFGYYQFLGVPSGQNYLMSVTHKSYQYEPRTLNLVEDIAGVDFIPIAGDDLK